MWRHNQGLVLAETLWVCCLLGLALTVGLVVWQPAESVSRMHDQRRQTDLASLQAALKEYAADHEGHYPAVNGPTNSDGQPTYYSCYDCGWDQASRNARSQVYGRDNWIPELVEKGYLPSLPIDPLAQARSACPVSGYIYLSGGVGYKIFSWCDPRHNLNDGVPVDAYCPEGATDASQLKVSPESYPALKPGVDPARPTWGYAVYDYELACF